MEENNVIEVCCIKKATEYLVDMYDIMVQSGDNCVMIALRREDAIECFRTLIEEYEFDIMLATINPEFEQLHYGVTIWNDGTVAIEPLMSDRGTYPMWDADFILVDGDVPSQWLIAQGIDDDRYAVIEWEEEDDTEIDMAYWQRGDKFEAVPFSEIKTLLEELFEMD